MSEVIQSLSICCPSGRGCERQCINHCKTCTARQHTNPYENKFGGSHVECFEYWQDVIKRMKYAQEKGCTTVMLTGSNEPQQNRRWLEGLYLAMQTLDHPFLNIEIQTTGAFLDRDYLEFLKMFGVTTVALSTFNIESNRINREIEESADKNLNIERLCKEITDLGMNLRICLNVTDYMFTDRQKTRLDKTILIQKKHNLLGEDVEISSGKSNETRTLVTIFIDDILNRCAELGASQVTFRKMWSAEGTPEAKWIEENTFYSSTVLTLINKIVPHKGKLINVLPYGNARYDYKGFSIVVDTDSMGKKNVGLGSTMDKTTNVETLKYYIIRENGKMYSSWDSPASLVF